MLDNRGQCNVLKGAVGKENLKAIGDQNVSHETSYYNERAPLQKLQKRDV